MVGLAGNLCFTGDTGATTISSLVMWLGRLLRRTCDGVCARSGASDEQPGQSDQSNQDDICNEPEFYMDTKAALGQDFPQKYFLGDARGEEFQDAPESTAADHLLTPGSAVEAAGHSLHTDLSQSPVDAQQLQSGPSTIHPGSLEQGATAAMVTAAVPKTTISGPKHGRRIRIRLTQTPDSTLDYDYESDVSYSSCASDNEGLEYGHLGWLESASTRRRVCVSGQVRHRKGL